jgi:exosortase D (VPLPA-CTERM-specific)
MSNYKISLKILFNREFIKGFKIPAPSLSGILGGLLIIAVVGFYWPVWADLVTSMLQSEDTSYGLILPFVSLYITYRTWRLIRQHPFHPSWYGLIVLFLGFMVYFVGDLFQSYSIPFFSFIIVIAGILILMGGWALLRQLAFPLFLLAFMMPYEWFFIQKLTFPLQLISSRLAAKFLSIFGIILYLQGNIIDLGGRQLNIAEACSGLRYLVNLWALGAIFCYFFQRRWWKVAVILAAIFPFAIVANSLRITTIGFFPMFQEGWWHSSLGLSIFLLGFDYLKLINWIVNRIEPPIPGPSPRDIEELSSGTDRDTLYTPYLIAGLAVVMLTGPFVTYLSNTPNIKLLQSLDNFPLRIGPYEGFKSYITDDHVLKSLAADSYLDISFVDQKKNSISLWIAYYENTRRNKRFHSPALCLQGAGWQVVDSGMVNNGGNHPIRYLLIQQGKSFQLVYYWYIQCGRWSSADQFDKRYHVSIDNLLLRRSDDSLIKIMTPVIIDIDDSKEKLNNFVNLLVPILDKFIKTRDK